MSCFCFHYPSLLFLFLFSFTTAFLCTRILTFFLYFLSSVLNGKESEAIVCTKSPMDYRPPLWLLYQLGPSLRSVSLRKQEYFENGDQVFDSLCNNVITSLRLNNAFRDLTTVPPCFWEQGSLQTFVWSRNVKEARSDQFLLNGTIPAAGFKDMTNLGAFYCCRDDYSNRQLHPIHGPIPLMPVSMLNLELRSMEISGSIPR